MAIHPHLLKSICFYLMPQLFPDALFFTLTTNLSSHLLLSLPFRLQAEWLLALSLHLPTEQASCFSPVAAGSLAHRKFWLCFSCFYLFIFYLRLQQREKHSIVIDLETYNFYWRSHLITKADLLWAL